MIFTRPLSVVLVFSVLLSGNIAFAAPQSQADSLNRLNSEAASQNITLSDTEKNKIQNSCQTAQNNLKSIRQKEQRIQRERTETYLDVQNEIDALTLRLKRQGVDVSSASTALMSYMELSYQYDRLSKSYYELLNDTIIIECRENPAAYIAGLTLVRQKRQGLLETTRALHDFVFNDMQNQFKVIKTELKV